MDSLSHGRRSRNWLPFEEARAYVHSLGLKSHKEWQDFCASGKKPENIPSGSPRTYSSDWISWPDWLGTDRVANQYRKFLPFEQAREYARGLHLQGREAWMDFCKTSEKSKEIPTRPSKTYPSEWISWGDWSGTANVSGKQKHREFLPFEQARAFVRELCFPGLDAWRKYAKSSERSKDIPANPSLTYPSEWVSWSDWIGTDRIANMHKHQIFLPFEQAREYVRALGFKNRREWEIYAQSNQRPQSIPYSPNEVYTQWEGMGDWLGTGNLSTSDPRFIPKTSEEIRMIRRKLNHKRRALKKAVAGTHTHTQIQEQLKRQKYRCYYAACGFAKFKRRKGEYIYHVEHTFPLSRVAGTGIPANDMSYIVLACPSCNDKKKDRFPWEWPEGGRLL